MTSTTFTILVFDDNMVEDDETFHLAIDRSSLSSKVTTEAAFNYSTVNIESDDCKPF